MGETKLRGVLAPVVTPFGADMNVDEDRFVAYCRHLLADGCTGLAPFGTTSEANSLALSERMHLLDAIIGAGIDPKVLMPGTGVCSVADTVMLTRHAVAHGVGGVLMLPPFYYKPVSDDGLYRFFAEVIEGVGDASLRIYLYHIPPIANVGISLGLVERLLRDFTGTVVGLKDSSGDWSNTQSLIATFATSGFDVFSGSEAQLLDNLRAGGVGTISASANVNAAAMRRVVDAFQAGASDVEACQDAVTRFRMEMQKGPLIQSTKAVVAHRTGHAGWLRMRAPLEPLGRDAADEIVRRVSSLAEAMAG